MKHNIFFLITFISIMCAAQTGVNTTNPDAALHVKSTSTTSPDVKIESHDDLDYSTILFRSNDNTTGTTLYDSMRILGGWQDTASTLFGNNRLSIEGYNGSTWQKVATFKANGNVGIGLTEPTSLLHIFSVSAQEPAVILETDNDVSLRLKSNKTGAGTNGEAFLEFVNTSSATNSWMTGMNDDNNFIIGYRPIGSLGPTPYTDIEVEIKPSADTDDWLIFEDNDAPAVDNGLAIRPNLNSKGAIGTATHLFKFGYFDDVYRNNRFVISDRRVKDNIKLIINPLATVSKLRGVTYTIDAEKHPFYNANSGGKEDLKQHGFIAQEVKEVIPEMVVEDKELNLNVINNYEQMYAFLVESIKELNAKADQISEELKLLEAENERLKDLKLKSKITAVNAKRKQ